MLLNLLILLNLTILQPDGSDPRKEDSKVYGIDISNHQGVIDWNKVKTWQDNSIQFIYIKATEGATFQDRSYVRNVTGAKASNIKIGSYHYFKITSSPKDQFKNFIKHVELDKQDLIPVVDVEEMNKYFNGSFHKNLKEFLDLVERHFGTKPIIYSFNSFYNKHLAHKYKEYRFMIGRHSMDEPKLFDKNEWHIWQFSDNETIDGITKMVDLNILNSKFGIESLLLPKSN